MNGYGSHSVVTSLLHMTVVIIGVNDLLLCYLFISARNSSCGKVMFSQACVNNSVHGGVCHRNAGIHTPPDRHPPRQTHPHPQHYGIRSTSGRYASYWNAFLLLEIFVVDDALWSVHRMRLRLRVFIASSGLHGIRCKCTLGTIATATDITKNVFYTHLLPLRLRCENRHHSRTV